MANKKQEKTPSLKKDIMFKAFFSRKGNEEFLIDFLEALLKIEIEDIKIKEEVSIEQLFEKEKGGRIDLQATLNDGIIVNIEMQFKNEHNIERRSDIYGAKTISRYFSKGEEYEDAKQVIMINILNYELFGFEEYISETVTVLDKHRDYKVQNIINTYFIELPKFRKNEVDMDKKINQWLSFIDNENRGRVEMAKEKNEVIKKAEKVWEYLTGDEAIKRMEELEEKWESDWNSSMSWERQEGKEEGKIEIIKKLLKSGMSVEEISKITDIPKHKIEKLKYQK